MEAWRGPVNPATGKLSIVFNKAKAQMGIHAPTLMLPCGQCVGCRLERSRQWAIRCVHEASLYEQNAFITLTYSDEHLPADRSVNHRPFQLFMKRLTKYTRKEYGHGVRFYMCGEYGENFGRPHFHACLFGHDFEDKTLWKMERDIPLYRSKKLEELWPYGYSTIGGVTFQSAAYVARYIMKKITGEAAANHYEWMDPETGEFHNRKPEYTTMSRRPGIGSRWLEKYRSDVYPDDFVVINGKKMKPPKYYDTQYELVYPTDLEQIKKARKQQGKKREAHNTPARLAVREKVQKARLSQLKRTI